MRGRNKNIGAPDDLLRTSCVLISHFVLTKKYRNALDCVLSTVLSA